MNGSRSRGLLHDAVVRADVKLSSSIVILPRRLDIANTLVSEMGSLAFISGFYCDNAQTWKFSPSRHLSTEEGHLKGSLRSHFHVGASTDKV